MNIRKFVKIREFKITRCHQLLCIFGLYGAIQYKCCYYYCYYYYYYM